MSNINCVHRDVEDHSEIMALRSLRQRRHGARRRPRTAQLAEAVRRLRGRATRSCAKCAGSTHELAARDLERDGMREALQQAMQFALAAEERSSSAECS